MGQDKESYAWKSLAESTVSAQTSVCHDQSALAMIRKLRAEDEELPKEAQKEGVRLLKGWSKRGRKLVGQRTGDDSAYLVSLSGLAEDPHEGNNGDYRDDDDGNQARPVQSGGCFARSIDRTTFLHPAWYSSCHPASHHS